MSISVNSGAFRDGEKIPTKYTCDGQDVSPPLSWGEPPEGTLSFALIVDDPDAGGWSHWVAFDIPADARGLPEALPGDNRLPNGMRQGTNDFGGIGYGGPCPPGGSHRYRFTVYALGKALELDRRASQATVLEACRECIIDEGRLTGIYR